VTEGTVRARATIAVWVASLCVITACDPVMPSAGPSQQSGTSAAATATPQPCSLLTQQTAAAISGDSAVTNQATNTFESIYGYIACIYTDIKHEANSVTVQIKRTPRGADPAALEQAAAFFEGGEPVQPYAPFPVPGIGEEALGEAIPGVALIVLSTSDFTVFVGGYSASVSATALRNGVEGLARQVAAAL
jgi:hypothetical protein